MVCQVAKEVHSNKSTSRTKNKAPANRLEGGSVSGGPNGNWVEPGPAVADAGGALTATGGDGGCGRPERGGIQPGVGLPSALGTVVEQALI